jgi:hypothetical protein
MGALLDPETAARMQKILALFDSPHDGESTGAFAAGTRILHARGVKWRDVISLCGPEPGHRHEPPKSSGLEWKGIARELLYRCDELSFKEHGFVLDVLKLYHLTDRQHAWLAAIAKRVLGGQA